MLKIVTYCDSFGVEHIPKQITKFIGNKNIIANIYRIKAYDSIMCILLYWIYWFHLLISFAWLYKYISSYWLWEQW